MKKTTRYIISTALLFLLTGTGSLYAQHYVGARIGYGNGTTRIYPKRETSTVWGLYSGGLAWKYFTAEKVVGGIEVDIIFMQQGFEVNDFFYTSDGSPPSNSIGKENSAAFYRRKVNSVMVPFFWQPHVYMFERRVRIFVNAGITFHYNGYSTEEYRKEGVNEPVVKQKYPYKINRDNRWGYGLCGGAGIGIMANSHFEVFAEWRYYIGMSDIRKNWNKYREDSGSTAWTLRSPMDGMQFSAGVFYKLGKGDILAAPGKKLAAKMAEREAERIAREFEQSRESSDEPEVMIIPVEGHSPGQPEDWALPDGGLQPSAGESGMETVTEGGVTLQRDKVDPDEDADSWSPEHQGLPYN